MSFSERVGSAMTVVTPTAPADPNQIRGKVAFYDEAGNPIGIPSSLGSTEKNVLDFGAVCDVVEITDASITAGTDLLSSGSRPFVQADAGKKFTLPSAAASGFVLWGTILSVSGGVAKLSVPAVTTVTNGPAYWGTDSTAAFQAAVDSANAAGRGTVVIPGGRGFLIGAVKPKSYVTVRGGGAPLYRNASAGNGMFSNAHAPSVGVTHFNVVGVDFIGEGRDQDLPYVAGVSRCPIALYNSTDISVRFCNTRDFASQGFAFSGCQRVMVTNNRFKNVCTAAAGNAIHFATQGSGSLLQATDAEISGNTVRGCMTAGVCVQTAWDVSAFSVYTPEGVRVHHNSIECTGFACIALETGRTGNIGSSSQGSSIRQVMVDHNHLTQKGALNSGTWGISASDNNGSGGAVSSDPLEIQDVLIDHNIINSSDGGIITQSSHTSIDSNIISAATKAIAIGGNGNNNLPYNQSATGNTIRMTAANRAIEISRVKRVHVENNKIEYPGGFSTPVEAIYLTTVTDYKVVDNEIEKSPGHGIHFFSCGVGQANHNKIHNCSDAAVNAGSGMYFNSCAVANNDVTECVWNKITDDRATAQMQYGISHNTTPQLVMYDNTIYGTTNAPISPIISGNDVRGMGRTKTNNGGSWPAAVSATSAPGSGTPLTNPDPWTNELIVSGGAMTAITFTGPGSGNTYTLNVTGGVFRWDIGWSITLTYTTAPTLNKRPLDQRK